jgi:glucokinase
MNTLALDIGGTKFSAALFDSAGAMIRRESRATDREGGKDWMLPELTRLVREWTFDQVGIGFGGPVLFARQTVALSTHVAGWSNFDLAGWCRDRWGKPVLMDNDANVGALGEGIHGAGRGARPLFYMTLSTGIGGGILTEHGLYRGADSYAGELGHQTIEPGGPLCLCGARGCLERLCCGLWLERDYGRPAQELLQDPEFTSRYVIRLARGLKSAIMILNPARIVIGGGISKAGDALFVPLRAELRRQITDWSRARIEVEPAALGDDSVLYGAQELAKEIPS